MNEKQKLEKFFTKEFTSLHEVMIVQDSDGSYELFNYFKIEPQNNGLYKVLPFTHTEEYIFSSIKNAFAYCVFRKNNRVLDSKRIKELDFLLDSVETLINQQQKLYRKTEDKVTKSIFLAKIHENKLKKNLMLKEINQFINISKYHQRRKFLEKESK